MGFVLPDKAGFVDVALRLDDALDMGDEQYEKYLLNPIKDNLIIKHEKSPLFLRMRKVLPWDLAQKVEDKKLGMVQNREGDKITQDMVPKLSWMYEEVRCALVDIVAEDGSSTVGLYDRDSGGGASYTLAAQLLEMGVMMDLWNARKNALKKQPADPDKKK